MKDATLIKAIKQGDASALKSVYVEHRAPFLAFAKKYPIKEDTSVDIYQDAIIALRENILKGKLDDLKSELKTYLFSIGKYMIYDKLKQNKKMYALEDNLKETTDETNLEFSLVGELTNEQKQLRSAFKLLGEKCKTILTLFYYRGFDLEDIVQELNYNNKDVVKSQKSRCIKTLKGNIIKSR